MSTAEAMHETFILTRRLAASPDAVFAAWADPAARAVWSAPAATVKIVYDLADFRVGGRDVVRCIGAEMPVMTAEVVYHDIVDGRRIVFSETVSSPDERLAAALISVQIAPDGDGSTLTVTVQLASLGAAGMGAEYRTGWAAALENLAVFVVQGGSGRVG